MHSRVRNQLGRLRWYLRIARRLDQSLTFLWREMIRRRPVLHAYRLRATGQTIHLRHRTEDLAGFAEVFLWGNYDFPAPVAAVLGNVPQPLRAADLGANIGLFGVRLLAQRRDAEIVAFEPDPENAKLLRATIASNQPASWNVVEACAATADGTVLFRQGQFLQSQIADDGEPFPAVDVFPVLETADFIKIDIEGAELPILKDERFANLKAQVVCLEYHPPHARTEIAGLLIERGYTIEPFEERQPGYGELWAWKSQQLRGARSG